MKSDVQGDLVIAVDYYDGEAEGLARCGGQCSYFIRLEIGEVDDINQYVSLAVDCALFEEIATLASATCPRSKVFVYSGSNAVLNRKLDQVAPDLRARLEQTGQRSQGRTYLDSIRSQRHAD